MRRKIGAIVVVVVGIAALAGILGQTGIKAQESKGAEKPATFAKVMADPRLPPEMKAMANTAVFGKVYSAWPSSDGNFFVGVQMQDGNVRGYYFKTGDFRADAFVKSILMAQETQLRVGAYEDPLTGMLGGFCVFNTP